MTYYPPQSPFSTGMAGKCPRCGRGKLFKGFLKVDTTCSSCNLDYSKADSGDGPAVFMIFILGFVAMVVLFVARYGFEANAFVALMLSIFSAIALTFILMQPLKGVMIALQFRNKAAEGTTDDEAPTDWT